MRANEYIARFIGTLDRLDQENIKIPGLILSHAGFGKTSTIAKYCEYMDYNLITLIPSMFSSDDVLGLQSVQNGKLVRLTPSWFNKMKETIKNGKRSVLFIDEITTCDPYIQGPLLDLIFNGNLGDEHLPNNLFIVAAGNYSEDLNNIFKMSAPLVNRFMLLNLIEEDFSIEELLENTFDNIKTKEEIEEFLGLSTIENPTYNYSKFVSWCSTSGNLMFGKTEYTEDPKLGLLGFTSIRSIDYSLKFTKMYMKTFGDNLWARIVGDTLGFCNSREGKPMHMVISSDLNTMRCKYGIDKDGNKIDVESDSGAIRSIADNIKKNGLTYENIERLDKYVDTTDFKNILSTDLSLLQEIIYNNVNTNSAIRTISVKLMDRLGEIYL